MSKKTHAHVNLNTDELKSFIKHMIENNRHIQEQGKKPVAINIEGEAGLNSK
jgi:predicted transcriptional regulator